MKETVDAKTDPAETSAQSGAGTMRMNSVETANYRFRVDVMENSTRELGRDVEALKKNPSPEATQNVELSIDTLTRMSDRLWQFEQDHFASEPSEVIQDARARIAEARAALEGFESASQGEDIEIKM